MTFNPNLAFFKYILVGLVSVLVDYLSLYIAYSLMMMGVKVSVGIGFFFSVIFNYLGHKKFTFNNTDAHLKVGTKYVFLLLIMGAFTVYSIAWLVSVNVNIYWAKLLTVSLVFIVTFVANRYWVYG